jgi:E3 ubiquitin-protein ligase SIAH1
MILLNHFSAEHKWHYASVSYNKAFRIHIAQGSTALLGEDGQLFLVNMVLEPLGGLISVFCIQPHITGSNFKCKLPVSGPEMSYYQVTQFQTKSTKLFDGLPTDCFLFFVPKVMLRESGANVTAMVSMTIIPP